VDDIIEQLGALIAEVSESLGDDRCPPPLCGGGGLSLEVKP
jgi:hypothetical protein